MSKLYTQAASQEQAKLPGNGQPAKRKRGQQLQQPALPGRAAKAARLTTDAMDDQQAAPTAAQQQQQQQPAPAAALQVRAAPAHDSAND